MDALEDFNPFDPECQLDPYPYYERMRREGGRLVRSNAEGGFWMAPRYRDVREGMKHLDGFTVHVQGIPQVDYSAALPIPTNIDPPEHEAYRQALAGALSPGRADRMEEPARACAAALIKKLQADGRCEFTGEFALPYVYEIFFLFFGAPLEDMPQFLEWEDQGLRRMPFDNTARDVAVNVLRPKVRAYFTGLIEARLESGERHDDVLDSIVHARYGDRPFTMDERARTADAIFRAGMHTTSSGLANMMHFLATHPDHRAQLFADPSLAGAAVEELLRYESLVFVNRTVTRPIEFCGQQLQPGELVGFPTASAGRDEEEFDQPDVVDFARVDANRHLAFGAGIHRCLGSHIARLELRVALEEIHTHLTDYVLDPDDTVERYTGALRTTERLPLLIAPFDRASQ
jgi:cytochrome P450